MSTYLITQSRPEMVDVVKSLETIRARAKDLEKRMRRTQTAREVTANTREVALLDGEVTEVASTRSDGPEPAVSLPGAPPKSSS